MANSVTIDTAHDGQAFNCALSDVPERKTDLVSGHYEIPASTGPTAVVVKITDMLGEEVLLLKQLEQQGFSFPKRRRRIRKSC
jgi:hypothetical protein